MPALTKASRSLGSSVQGLLAASTTRLSCCAAADLSQLRHTLRRAIQGCSARHDDLRAGRRHTPALPCQIHQIGHIRSPAAKKDPQPGRRRPSPHAWSSPRASAAGCRAPPSQALTAGSRRRGLGHRLGDILGGLEGAADIDAGAGTGHRHKGVGPGIMVPVQVDPQPPRQFPGLGADFETCRQHHQIKNFRLFLALRVKILYPQIAIFLRGQTAAPGNRQSAPRNSPGPGYNTVRNPCRRPAYPCKKWPCPRPGDVPWQSSPL